jgi:hypothetical protein
MIIFSWNYIWSSDCRERWKVSSEPEVDFAKEVSDNWIGPEQGRWYIPEILQQLIFCLSA